MIATRSTIGTLLIALVAAASPGCSSESEDVTRSTSAACARGTGGQTQLDRDVSFGREVLPILQESCSYVSCHGAPGRNGIYLGPPGAGSSSQGSANASSIRAALLEPSPRASMPFVTPGEPGASWLVRKLEGQYCGLTCEGGCGERMPKGGDPIDPAELATIVTWIANGAPAN